MASRLATLLLGLAPALALTQDLQTCLDSAGLRNIVDTNPAWTEETAVFQKRITPQPAGIVFPTTRDEIALSLECARNASVKANVLGASHSFAAYGFGEPGNLVINTAAFNSVSYDESTQLLSFEAGVHVGPAVKYLWDTAQRHIPHVRGSHVGLVGSSIGGGFGTTSRFAGTPMDSIVEVEYMLWDGSIITAGEGSDLLFAAQGAGASYGVILSMKTKTHEVPDSGLTYTLSLGDIDVDTATNALLKVQEYAQSEDTPDELALRWSLAGPPYSASGFWYGTEADFDAAIAPLVSSLLRIANTTSLAKEVKPSFWDMEIAAAGPGMDQPNGGSLGGRFFYVQALTVDRPLTFEAAKTLLSAARSHDHPDLASSGFLDLWGGVSRDIADGDTSYAHGNNLWLIRMDASSRTESYPADGIEYMKNLYLPFEEAMTEDGIPLRGFVNYVDTELNEEEWSARLYGENYDRLLQIKREVDPYDLFGGHGQAIPLKA